MKSRSHQTYDFIIVGGGIVGLCLAYRLIERNISQRIAILEKEPQLGLHTSGRNSGVLHSGLYYNPGSLKARVAVTGARRLRKWVESRGLPINNCGKVIVPQAIDLDSQLEILFQRAKDNGVEAEIWDESQLHALIPQARTASGRAIWVPSTAVIKPISIIRQLEVELVKKGVQILLGENSWVVDPARRTIHLSSGVMLSYGHLVNCAGLQADRIAHKFDIAKHYSLIPFRGLYWELRKDCPIKPIANLYPVPDLNMPFLGVHFTPSADLTPLITIGPTATFGFGREHYRGLSQIEPSMALSNLTLLAKQYLLGRGGLRRYVHEQAFLAITPFLLRAAQELIPDIRLEHIQPSSKIGIRSQLFNHNTQELENDFICLAAENSTHILNAISPAFTASFSLADLIIDKIDLERYGK